MTGMDDKALKRAYMIVTGLWVGLFLLRLVVQVPLYLTNHVAALGVTRLLMGIPFWALANLGELPHYCHADAPA